MFHDIPLVAVGKSQLTRDDRFHMKSRVLTRQQVRQFDQIAIHRFGIHSLVLMENAARGATDFLCAESGGQAGSVVIFCGPGNNGGDGLVMARHLHLRGASSKVILLADSEKLTQDSAANLRILQQTAVPVTESPRPEFNQLTRILEGADWIVDAILGTGASLPLRPPLDELLPGLNDHPARRMAVDIPTGLDCDTDQASPAAFNADFTATFVALKPVMLTPTGKQLCGDIKIVDIGAPPETFEFIDGEISKEA
ncbi:MAG: NAD(P)H-hydrate epimerase [Pirellulaceae bacterium]